MIADNMLGLVKNSSVIRAMFEEGNRLAKIHGAENVYDFSLGNPNVPAPAEVGTAIQEILDEEKSTYVHGYMSNAGYEDVRKTIAQSINQKFDTKFDATNIVMTVGAAGGLNVILKTLLNPGDEVITFAPFFGEYRGYTANHQGILVVVAPNTIDFQPNLTEFALKITKKTKAVIVNNPNNPTGVVYSKETVKKMAAILEEKQKEFGTDIYIVSDEPYRELVYDGVDVPYLTKYYNNTIVGYSYSKSLSLPGERIGYLVIPDEAADSEDIKAGASVATRNRELLYNGLIDLGFECVKPQGAFYLFVKSPTEDEKVFCDIAKKYNVLIVPGSAFGCAGYVRIVYCVSYDTIKNSLPKFAEIAKELGVTK